MATICIPMEFIEGVLRVTSQPRASLPERGLVYTAMYHYLKGWPAPQLEQQAARFLRKSSVIAMQQKYIKFC